MAKKKNRVMEKENFNNTESEVEEILNGLPVEGEEELEETSQVEVEEPVVVEEEPVVVEVKETTPVVEVEEPVVVEEEPVVVKPQQQSKKDRGAILMHKVEFELNNFAEAMDPKKSITKEVAGQWHMTLFLLIKRVLSTEEQVDFNTEWGTLLGFVNKNRDGVYSEKWIFRHTDAWTGSGLEFNQYRRLIMLILNTADPKTRKAAMSEINFELLVEGLKPVQVNRLGSFYSV